MFLLLLTAVVLYLVWIVASPFLAPIVTAALLAIAIHPLFARLLRSTGSATLASLLATLLVLVIILVPTVLIINKVAHELAGLYGWLNEQQSQQGSWSVYFGSLIPLLTGREGWPEGLDPVWMLVFMAAAIAGTTTAAPILHRINDSHFKGLSRILIVIISLYCLGRGITLLYQ